MACVSKVAFLMIDAHFVPVLGAGQLFFATLSACHVNMVARGVAAVLYQLSPSYSSSAPSAAFNKPQHCCGKERKEIVSNFLTYVCVA